MTKQTTVDVAELKKRGIFMTVASTFFDRTGLQALLEISRGLSATLSSDAMQQKITERVASGAEKNYFIPLSPTRFEASSHWMRLALRPPVLALVQDYLGKPGYLRSIYAKIDFPADAIAKATQKWHRDRDDDETLKVFIYLTDVTEANGPFCFIPESHIQGALYRHIKHQADGRISDETMETYHPQPTWWMGTGQAGSVILADTTGFHRGARVLSGYRVMVQLEYTSAEPDVARTQEFVTTGEAMDWTDLQKAAFYGKALDASHEK